MTLTLAQDAMNETFHDCEETVKERVRQFCRRYRFDVEEALGLAHEAFCEAYYDYQRAKQPDFVKWVSTKVWYKLIEAYDRIAFRGSAERRADSAQAVKRLWVELDTFSNPMRSFQLLDFLDELTDDARAVAELALHSPGDVRLTLAAKGNTYPRTIRAALREMLKDCGWNAARITESFNEIRHALAR